MTGNKYKFWTKDCLKQYIGLFLGGIFYAVIMEITSKGYSQWTLAEFADYCVFGLFMTLLIIFLKSIRTVGMLIPLSIQFGESRKEVSKGVLINDGFNFLVATVFAQGILLFIVCNGTIIHPILLGKVMFLLQATIVFFFAISQMGCVLVLKFEKIGTIINCVLFVIGIIVFMAVFTIYFKGRMDISSMVMIIAVIGMIASCALYLVMMKLFKKHIFTYEVR